MKEPVVFLADDEPDVLNIMSKRIAAEGYQVLTAADGEEALSQIRAYKPDIVLLDLVMPKLSGFDVLESIRQDPPDGKWIPIIIVSAKSERDDMQRGFQLEADHYLTKPCNMDDILRAIKLMISLVPQRKSAAELAQDEKH